MRPTRAKPITLRRETVRILTLPDLAFARGGAAPAPQTSFIYSCIVSCTWTDDCTSSTTFAPTV